MNWFGVCSPLISVLEPAAPELSLARLEFADAGDVYPLQFGIAEAHTIAGNSRQALIASRLLRPLLSSLPAESTTWVDARKLVDRLDFDGRELLSYVRLVDPQRAAESLAEASGSLPRWPCRSCSCPSWLGPATQRERTDNA